MNAAHSAVRRVVAGGVALFLVGTLAISCSDSDSGTGPAAPVVPYDVAPEVAGLGQPALEEIEVSFSSGTLDTVVTLAQGVNGTVSVVLPAGTYTIDADVEGTLEEFYNSSDTTVVSDGVTPIVYRPALTVEEFGTVQLTVTACATQMPIGDQIRIELGDASLLGDTEVFYADSTGQLTIPYVPAGEVEMVISAMGTSAGLYAEAEGVWVVADGQVQVIGVCLQLD